MYGAFDAIIGQLQRTVGYPYTTMPTTLAVYGEGGVAGISTLCGALNGAAAAIFVVARGIEKERREAAYPPILEMFNWYEQAELPKFRPAKPKFEIVKSVSNSPLCHASVTNWCKAAKVKAFSPERPERCGWITGSVARFAANLLNEKAKGGFNPAFELRWPRRPAVVDTTREARSRIPAG